VSSDDRDALASRSQCRDPGAQATAATLTAHSRFTKAEPSGRSDSGLSGLLLCISGRPERQPAAGLSDGDEPELVTSLVKTC
jgi:hypothetical protein